MLAKIIDWSGRNPFLVLLATLFVIIGGVYAVMKTPLDALPDLSDVQVIVYTEYPGQAPQVVEDQVTYPLTTSMLAVPKSKVVRGFSFFGASFVYVIFEDGTDIYWARSRVLEYLNFAASRLPKGVSPRSARRHRRGLGLPVRAAGQGQDAWPNCARSRTGTCATSSPRRRAWPKWRRWAALCRPTRSPSIR
jgi:Cu/Ag efflux pump CusA